MTDTRLTPSQQLASRALAAKQLEAVLHRLQPLEDLPESPGLPARDRSFARLLVLTVLRRLGRIDALLRGFLDRPAALAGSRAETALRLGVAQLLFLDTPAHAAVDTSVALTSEGQPRLAGLVNAVLRRVDREGRDVLAAQDAERVSVPGWLWNAWVGDWGEARARAAIANLAGEPPLDITVKDADRLAEWAGKLEAEPLFGATLRRPSGGLVTALPGFDSGEWWIQDAAAALPARLLGAVEGKTVYDLCAAPGGKTSQLAAAGARVTAVDRDGRRLKRLSENLKRLGLSAASVEADAGVWRPSAQADAVLLDAPCTATGTARRHPDVPWLKRAEDMRSLAALQAKLLRHAVSLVRPGGVLVFSTCSAQKAEGEAQADALLASGAPVAADPLRADELGAFAAGLDAQGRFRSLPGEQGLDGFFIARFRRV